MPNFRALISNFSRRHPLLRDALVWSIPALLLGAALRLVFLHYSPYAYWGSDSRSFFAFTDGVLEHFRFSLNEKRRYLYPIFLLPVTLLPGSTLAALAWIQAGIGLASVVVFAYVVRRIFVAWKWLVVPLTVLLAGMPMLIWQEHELIGDIFLIDGLVWCGAAWAAWVSQRDPDRARRLWWLFLATFAFIVLSKASVKFFWPGLLAALVLVGAWRTLRWPHWAALGALFLAGLTTGDDDQGDRLLYNTAFPLTQLHTPPHAEIKAELADWVRATRVRIDAYANEDYEVQKYLRARVVDPARPKLSAASNDPDEISGIFRDLAKEAILAEPAAFLSIGLHRFLGSCNPGDLNDWRFKPDYFARRLDEGIVGKRNSESMLRHAFGIPRREAFPSREQFRAWTNPRPDSWAATFFPKYVEAYNDAGALVVRPAADLKPLMDYRPTVLGALALLGALLSLIPPYARPLGVWMLAIGAGIFATYLVGIQQPRYFAPAWPLVLLALGVVFDWPARLLGKRAPAK